MQCIKGETPSLTHFFNRVRLRQFETPYSCDSRQAKSSVNKGKPLMV